MIDTDGVDCKERFSFEWGGVSDGSNIFAALEPAIGDVVFASGIRDEIWCDCSSKWTDFRRVENGLSAIFLNITLRLLSVLRRDIIFSGLYFAIANLWSLMLRKIRTFVTEMLLLILLRVRTIFNEIQVRAIKIKLSRITKNKNRHQFWCRRNKNKYVK